RRDLAGRSRQHERAICRAVAGDGRVTEGGAVFRARVLVDEFDTPFLAGREVANDERAAIRAFVIISAAPSPRPLSRRRCWRFWHHARSARAVGFRAGGLLRGLAVRVREPAARLLGQL